ncbi:glucose-6-phosphate isomerase [Nonlabens dokdonensis]|uniref:Glucose-6-phosphate isomerase n=2 Tax=Nonlabens dokdonensis TaxID=328515 RepID=L7W761_NONDD|nr:glucose-6-phosphate isomerase [Nonlabens dokdonensis]AGC76037.1 glucose-6-phosphate isomerase [Nonlabens dokdonensis DSW-6]PZX43709.1 glucose-6-phosphate isomerase [Nonlabens dokdonensis]
MKNINPTSTDAWNVLTEHFKDVKNLNLREAFSQNSNRAEELTLTEGDFLVDLSKNLITKETQQKLIDLAKECELDAAIHSYFNGEKINATENRAVLHTALRTQDTSSKVGEKVTAALASKEKMFAFVDAVNDGKITAANGQKFDTIVNIGIGGSDLGPVMIYEALQAYKNEMTLHFVSNVEGDHVEEVIKKINPETTLFVIVSKSFGTQETLTNSTTIRNWFSKKVNDHAIAQHFIAVSSNVQRAVDFGIDQENIFPMFDWVGGRFSLWSTVGMSVALGIGTQNFQDLLEGAHEMDEHFKNTTFEKNIPVQLGLLTIWYNNFYKAQSEAVIPYTQYLHRLPAYLQQAIMESNGKSVDRNGNPVNYETGNIVWGEPGTNSQHAFFQLIHQGTKLIPAHFIAFAKAKYHHPDHHNKLMANFFAQTEALMNGKNQDEVIKDLQSSGKSEEEINKLAPFKVFTGNKPTTTILIDELTPRSLGKLVAMYEHKIFVEGVIWNIYSYDQWGVELGKILADRILNDIENSESDAHDASTTQLLQKFYSINN